MKTLSLSRFNPLHGLRQQLDAIEVSHPRVAQWICQLIPAHCPFECKIRLAGYTLLYIPPLCKLNPFYYQLLTLRLKAMMYLAQQQDSELHTQ